MISDYGPRCCGSGEMDQEAAEITQKPAKTLQHYNHHQH